MKHLRFVLVCALAVGLLAASSVAAAVIERDFSFPAGLVQTLERGGVTEVRVEGGTADFTPGAPDLPWVSEQVEVPAGLRVTKVELVSIETALLASRALLPATLKAVAGAERLERTTPDPRWFSRAGFQPASPVRLGYQGWMRGQNLAYLLVAPTRWDAVSGRLERVVRLRVRLTLEPGMSPPVERRRIVPEWETATARGGAAAEGVRPLLDAPSRTAQPFSATQVPSVLGSPVAYLIITNDEMAGEFQRLADWKTQSGVPAVVRTMSFIRQQYPAGADDAERVRKFIRDAYSRWGTQWVLLGGDTEVIPTRYVYLTYYLGGESMACDMYYSCLDGNWNADGDATYGEAPADSVDLLPEVWVGRAPATTVDEAAQFVDKSMQYVRQPVGDYENRLLMFAEVLFPPDWTLGDLIILDGASLAEELLPSIKTHPSFHYARLYENETNPAWEPGALHETRAVVLDSLNQGYNLCVHFGHGYRNVMSVGDANLDNNDALGLHNGNRLFNLYASNCTSNAIDFPCIGEAYLHAPNGGAVTNVGASDLEFPAAGRNFDKEYFRVLFQDSVNAVGEAAGRQKLPFVGQANADNAYRWTEYVLLLLGDPELRIYTGTPRTLIVTRPATMTLGDTTLSVSVATAQGPLAGARVSAYKAGDEYKVGTTDASGNLTLPFRPDQPGSFFLTVTGYDCQPYQATINLVSGVGPVLADQAPTFQDDNLNGTLGNGDGIPDAGETVRFKVPLHNNGPGTATNVIGTLTTTDPWVSITSPNVSYGSMLGGADSNPASGFVLAISAGTPDQHEAAFRLELVDGSARTSREDLQVVLRAPELHQYSHTVLDTGGNSDGRPDPGETVSYTLALRNLGTAPALQVSAKLRSKDGLATVTDSTALWGTIAPGEEKSGDAVVFMPSNTGAKLSLVVSDQYGVRLTQDLDLVWPAAPTNLAGTGFASSIKLTWTKSSATDLLGYNVYRGASAGGPFTKITPVPTGRTAYYLDDGLAPLTYYYYRVSAVDSSGNESAQSPVASATTSPPTHNPFPFTMGRNTPASVAVDHLYPGYPLDIAAGANVLYVWHPDGSAPVDADGSALTTGDFTNLGSYYAAGPSLADLDGDGIKEVIGPTYDSKAVYVFDLAGQVKPGWPVPTANEVWSAAAIGDLDKDGTKELVFGSNGPPFYVLRANGTEWMDGDNNPATQGVFKLLGDSWNLGTPALADLDGDGFLDIVYGSFDGKLYAWHSNGTNLPGFPITLAGPITASAAIGYLDGPGDTQLDIVVPTGYLTGSTSRDSLYCFRANGQRRPGWPINVVTGHDDRCPSPALADMNGDGFVDVVFASTDGLLHVFDRNGVGVPPCDGVRFSALTGVASECSPVVADIDGDGHPDIVIGDENGVLTAISGLTGLPLPGFPITLGNAIKGTPALCDCDGDGKTEIVVAGWDAKLQVWDYDFPFSPGAQPPWPQFHHDALRTGLATNPAFVGVEEPPPAALPSAIEFAAPSPNPAATAARWAWAIPSAREGATFELAIYDLAGRRVRTLERGLARPGRYSAVWDLRDDRGLAVGTGIYLARFSLGAEHRTRKLVVVH